MTAWLEAAIVVPLAAPGIIACAVLWLTTRAQRTATSGVTVTLLSGDVTVEDKHVRVIDMRNRGRR
jgi:hypothetical protein